MRRSRSWNTGSALIGNAFYESEIRTEQKVELLLFYTFPPLFIDQFSECQHQRDGFRNFTLPVHSGGDG